MNFFLNKLCATVNDNCDDFFRFETSIFQFRVVDFRATCDQVTCLSFCMSVFRWALLIWCKRISFQFFSSLCMKSGFIQTDIAVKSLKHLKFNTLYILCSYKSLTPRWPNSLHSGLWMRRSRVRYPVGPIVEMNFSKLVHVLVIWVVVWSELRYLDTHSARNSIVWDQVIGLFVWYIRLL